MADTFTLQVEAGATFDSISFEYLEDDEITPVPMTGWTAKLQIRETAEAELTLEVIPTITVATGLIEFAFTPTQTSLLTLPRYVYAVELTDTSGHVIRLIEGGVKVSPEVVR